MIPILENQRARLIPFDAKKALSLKDIIFEDNIWKYMGHYIRNNNDLEAYINNTMLAFKNNTAIPFLVIDKDYGNIAGCTRIGNLDLNNRRAEIGWTWYGTDYQGTGLNSSVKKLLLEYAFKILNLNRVQLGADTRNLRSQKAIEKLNAVKEGIRRDHYIDSEGISRNDVYYSITKKDWNSIK